MNNCNSESNDLWARCMDFALTCICLTSIGNRCIKFLDYLLTCSPSCQNFLGFDFLLTLSRGNFQPFLHNIYCFLLNWLLHICWVSTDVKRGSGIFGLYVQNDTWLEATDILHTRFMQITPIKQILQQWKFPFSLNV